MAILSQFLVRLAFGLAVGMAITSSRQVSSGYFRNHLYVTLGLATLAAMVLFRMSEPAVAWLAVAAAVASYAGSVAWLYEAKRTGVVLLWLVAACALAAAWLAMPSVPSGAGAVLWWIAPVSSGLVLGVTMAAMLLGHWYLNSPGMELGPLRRLLVAMGAAVAFQAVVSAIGLACEIHYATTLSTSLMLFELLRWSFGIIGVGALAWMAWRTLQIPNTQSATGILYVAVIGVFVGELTSQLLSAGSAFPL